MVWVGVCCAGAGLRIAVCCWWVFDVGLVIWLSVGVRFPCCGLAISLARVVGLGIFEWFSGMTCDLKL